MVSAANRVIFKPLQVDIEIPETFPQELKPRSFQIVSSRALPSFAARLKSCPFKT